MSITLGTDLEAEIKLFVRISSSSSPSDGGITSGEAGR